MKTAYVRDLFALSLASRHAPISRDPDPLSSSGTTSSLSRGTSPGSPVLRRVRDHGTIAASPARMRVGTKATPSSSEAAPPRSHVGSAARWKVAAITRGPLVPGQTPAFQVVGPGGHGSGGALPAWGSRRMPTRVRPARAGRSRPRGVHGAVHSVAHRAAGAHRPFGFCPDEKAKRRRSTSSPGRQGAGTW